MLLEKVVAMKSTNQVPSDLTNSIELCSLNRFVALKRAVYHDSTSLGLFSVLSLLHQTEYDQRKMQHILGYGQVHQ